MTEDLLAIVTVIAIWKIIQVWILKSRLARKEKEKAAVKGELERLAFKFEDVDFRLHRYMTIFGPLNAVKGTKTKTDDEWPELL